MWCMMGITVSARLVVCKRGRLRGGAQHGEKFQAPDARRLR